MSYHYIEDKEFLSKLKSICSETINWLVQDINKGDFMKVKQHLVGSGAKNLILQNAKEPIDLDYNLEILQCENWKDCRQIKEYIKEKYNDILNYKEWDNCDDSTSSLTTKKRYFTEGNNTLWSIDLAITCRYNDDTLGRLIHNKTGYIQTNTWCWEQSRDSKGLEKRVEKLKQRNKWNEIRRVYLYKKNMYLSRPSWERETHQSFIVYIETINELYDKKQGGIKKTTNGIILI